MGVRVSWIALALAAFAGCSSGDGTQPGGEAVAFKQVAGDQGFLIPTSGTAVIQTAEQWQVLVREYWVANRLEPPAIDFASEMAVAVFWGQHHGGCPQEIEAIESVTRYPDSMVVRVGPLPDLGSCEALLAPVQIVTLPASGARVVFSGTVPETEPLEIAAEDVAGYEKFAIAEPGTRVIRDQEAWLALWEQYWNEFAGDQRTDPPAIDFERNMVLAVGWGDDFSGCTNKATLIERVEFTCPVACAANVLRVTLVPVPDLGNCREVVAPVHMVTVPQTTAEVRFTGAVP